MNASLTSIAINELLRKYPYAEDFFSSIGLNDIKDSPQTCEQIISCLTDAFLEDCGMDREQILAHFLVFMQKMYALKTKSGNSVNSITLIGGHDKSGKKENATLLLMPGEVISIVGPTGSGKSRLLGDIECLAQMDTPTGRQVLINGSAPLPEKRFSVENKLVAQLSQNMNFVMDLSVEEFVTMHAESRMVENIGGTVNAIIACANELAGEKFSAETSVTQLSGGQSRALMIADTALLSTSPVVLIDEIENAGVDRQKALELLVKKEKIVLLSTHDPILALMGNRRVVIKNGGMDKIIETSIEEQKNLGALQKFDSKMVELRNMLRTGYSIEFDIMQYFLK